MIFPSTPGPAPRRPWPRRHPIATVILPIYAAIFALVLILPGDNDRPNLIVGTVGLYLPVALVVWLVPRVIDRRTRRAAADAPFAAGAPLAWDGPPVSVPTGPWPPVATPSMPPTATQIRRDAVLAMTPTESEQLRVRVLLGLGYTDVRRTGGAGDLGADVVGTDPQGRSTIVECKRYAPGNDVGSPTIQTFIGMQTVHHKADRGIVMTTAEFSRPAIQLAKEHDIVLIDGDDIVKVPNLTGGR